MQQRVVQIIFVNAADVFSTTAPLGTFRIRVASGQVWYGDDNYFGPDTVYRELDKTFIFSAEDRKVSGADITLTLVKNGNLDSTPISKDRF